VQKRAGTILSDGINTYILSFLCGFSWPQFGNLIVTLFTSLSNDDAPSKKSWTQKLERCTSQATTRMCPIHRSTHYNKNYRQK
jgi:hypothetical protein